MSCQDFQTCVRVLRAAEHGCGSEQALYILSLPGAVLDLYEDVLSAAPQVDRQYRSPPRRDDLLEELDDLLATLPQLLGDPGDRSRTRSSLLELDGLR